MTITITQLISDVIAWDDMGVAGIFLDQAGCEFGVTRRRQNEIVDYIHGRNLNVFINTWNPDETVSVH